METWTDSLVGNADFAAFMQQIQKVTEYHGANLAVRVKSWGEGPAQISGEFHPRRRSLLFRRSSELLTDSKFLRWDQAGSSVDHFAV